jgi:hypothetical protein
MLLADWISKSQHPQHTIAKTDGRETEGRERERDTHAKERDTLAERGGDSNVKRNSSGKAEIATHSALEWAQIFRPCCINNTPEIFVRFHCVWCSRSEILLPSKLHTPFRFPAAFFFFFFSSFLAFLFSFFLTFPDL